MRRIVLTLAVVAALLPASAAASTRSGWDPSEQRTVQNAGVLPALSDGSFHGGDPLTADQFNSALAAFAQRMFPVTILRIGQSAGNPRGESPQRPYAAHPNVEPRVKRWSRPQRRRVRRRPVKAGAAG